MATSIPSTPRYLLDSVVVFLIIFEPNEIPPLTPAKLWTCDPTFCPYVPSASNVIPLEEADSLLIPLKLASVTAFPLIEYVICVALSPELPLK